MPSIEPGSFGLAIAFLAPGAVGLWGISLFAPTVREWFGATAQSQATAGGFLFALLGSFAVGLFLSGLRQEVLDRFLFDQLLKIRRPAADESKLTQPDILVALRYVSDNLYRYYQFYSNMAFAIVFAYATWLIHDWGWSKWRFAGLVLLILSVVGLTMSSKYSLKRYYGALSQILAPSEEGNDEQRIQEVGSQKNSSQAGGS